MKFRALLIAIMFLHIIDLSAKGKLIKCGGTYPYTYSENISHAEAKAKAVENAIIMALADKFGTTITSQSLLELTNEGDRFDQISRLQIKGKLVRHIYDPHISVPQFADNLFTVNVTVAFYAKAIEYAPTEFVVHVLRNGMDDRHNSDVFNAGDKFYMSFTSPKAGYVAVFYEDRESVACMLPYVDDDDKPFYVEKGKRYLFFDVTNNTYHFSCGDETEINYIHVLFSPKEFIDGDLIREMTCPKFQKWLGIRQSYDDELQVQSIMIKIKPLKE